MNAADTTPSLQAQVVLPCADVEATLAFFTEKLGFRVDAIAPADRPTTAVISGHGVRLCLQRGHDAPPGVVRLLCGDPQSVAGGALDLTAPNGTHIELRPAEPPLALPPVQPSFVVSRLREATWGVGRAGMRYRDLVPNRQGGRFIASHIQIPDGGPVPDYIHFHNVHFQMIYCRHGWVRVVYEDQGPPFVMQAGDCVLQPPRIRHRVLEASPGLEVIEIACPADHPTFADHELALPTARVDADRSFAGQRFVHHHAAAASWEPWRIEGFACRDLGIEVGTEGLAAARVVRRDGAPRSIPMKHAADFLLLFLLEGAMRLTCEGHGEQRLGMGDAVAIPRGLAYQIGECAPDMQFLETSLPAERWIVK